MKFPKSRKYSSDRKIVRNSVYSDNSMNSAATILRCRQDKFNPAKSGVEKQKILVLDSGLYQPINTETPGFS